MAKSLALQARRLCNKNHAIRPQNITPGSFSSAFIFYFFMVG